MYVVDVFLTNVMQKYMQRNKQFEIKTKNNHTCINKPAAAA